MLVTPRQIARWAARFELNIFTGRNRQELQHTFGRWPAASHFRQIVTMDDVSRMKPHPDGLPKIVSGREAATALNIGANGDDALPARAAGVPILPVFPPAAHQSRE